MLFFQLLYENKRSTSFSQRVTALIVSECQNIWKTLLFKNLHLIINSIKDYYVIQHETYSTDNRKNTLQLTFRQISIRNVKNM